jgi:hypothetical protein
VCTVHFNVKYTVFHSHNLALFVEFVCFSEEITTVNLTVNYLVFVKETPRYKLCGVQLGLKVLVRRPSPYKGLRVIMCHVQSVFRGILMNSTSYRMS